MLVTYERLLGSYEGDPTDAPQELTEARLAEAERLLLRTCPALRTLVQADSELREFVEDVIIRAVLRTVRNTDPGLKSETLGNYSYTRDSLAASGNIWFDRADLAALPCGGGPRIGSVKTSPSPTFANLRPRIMPGRGIW